MNVAMLSEAAKSFVAGIAHPELRALAAYWDGKRKRGLPRRQDLDIVEMRSWFGQMSMIEVLRGGASFRYVVHGSRLAELRGQDLTGLDTSALQGEERSRVELEYRQVARTGQPLYIQQRRALHKPYKLVAKLILPLSSDGITVDRLLAALYPLDDEPARVLSSRAGRP